MTDATEEAVDAAIAAFRASSDELEGSEPARALRLSWKAALTAASAHTGERMARAIEALLPEIEEAEIGHGGGSHDDECPTCAAIKEAGAALAAYRSASAPEPMAGAGWNCRDDLVATLKAVLYFFGPDGANKVTRHVLMARRSRESNAEIDELERVFGLAPLPSPPGEELGKG